jgi:hypothetical protein
VVDEEGCAAGVSGWSFCWEVSGFFLQIQDRAELEYPIMYTCHMFSSIKMVASTSPSYKSVTAHRHSPNALPGAVSPKPNLLTNIQPSSKLHRSLNTLHLARQTLFILDNAILPIC